MSAAKGCVWYLMYNISKQNSTPKVILRPSDMKMSDLDQIKNKINLGAHISRTARKCETKGKGKNDLLINFMQVHIHRWATHMKLSQHQRKVTISSTRQELEVRL